MAEAEIIAVGSELLTPQRLDTNSLFITEQLNLLGIEIIRKQVIGDDRERLATAIRSAIASCDVLLLSGGLGPTEDDVTRDAVAAALNRELVFSEEQKAILEQRFASIRRKMAEINLRQAFVIEGAEVLPNPHGSAPGQWVRAGSCSIFLLPGPPRELKAMLQNEVVPRLQPLLPKQVIKVRSFRITGIGESDLDALIAPVYSKYTNPVTTVLSSPGDLWVHLRARCDSEQEADSLLHEVGNPIAQLLGDRVYSTDAEDTLERVVARMLREKGATISTAESCTGGLLASRLTEHGGSSDFFLGGFVTYTDQQKIESLGVQPAVIAKHSAVSEPVATSMAEGARNRTGSTYALSVTGYAGPCGGTEKDPIGTVYIGIASPSRVHAVRVHYGSDRQRVRTLATQAALDLVRREMLNGR